MKTTLLIACAAAFAAYGKTIQMPRSCTTPDGMCIDAKEKRVNRPLTSGEWAYIIVEL